MMILPPILLLIATAQGPNDIQYHVSAAEFKSLSDCDAYVRSHTSFGPESKSNDGSIYYFENNRANIGAIVIPANSKVRTTCLDTNNLKG